MTDIAKTRPDAYGLARPTTASVRAALERVFGAAVADDIWREGCARAGVAVDVDLPLDALRTVCARIALQAGLPGVIGASLRVRCDTYACLERVR